MTDRQVAKRLAQICYSCTDYSNDYYVVRRFIEAVALPKGVNTYHGNQLEGFIMELLEKGKK